MTLHINRHVQVFLKSVIALVAIAGFFSTWLAINRASAKPSSPPLLHAKSPTTVAASTSATSKGLSASTKGLDAPDDGLGKIGKASKPVLSGKLNINTAVASDFMKLPGIGPSKAERIVSFPGKNGAFKRVADLRRVKGIGYKTLKKLEPHLQLTGESDLIGK